MSFSKNLFRRIASSLPVSLARQLSNIPLLLPYHHLISDEERAHVSELYQYKTPAQFTNDLEWLLKHYTPVSGEQVYQHVFERKPLPDNAFLISFDDGFREVHDTVAPILKEKGVPAIAFINPSFIDNRELFYRCKLSLLLHRIKKDTSLQILFFERLSVTPHRYDLLRAKILKLDYTRRELADEWGSWAGLDFNDYLIKDRPFMSSAQLEDLKRWGFTVGAHSMDHPNYGVLSEEAQFEETIASLGAIGSLTGSQSLFSFPHEDKPVSARFFDRLENRKILFFGTQNNRPEKPYPILHRFNAERPELDISRQVKALHLYHALLRGNKAVRRDQTR